MSENEKGKQDKEAKKVEKPGEPKKTKKAEKSSEPKKAKKAEKPSAFEDDTRGLVKLALVLVVFTLVTVFVLSFVGIKDRNELIKELTEVSLRLRDTQKTLETEVQRRKAIEKNLKASAHKVELPPYTPGMQILAAQWRAELKLISIEILEAECAKPFGQNIRHLSREWANLKKRGPAVSSHFSMLLKICYFYKRTFTNPKEAKIGRKLLIRWAYSTYVAACKWHSPYNIPLILSDLISSLEFYLGTYRDPYYKSVAPGPCPKISKT